MANELPRADNPNAFKHKVGADLVARLAAATRAVQANFDARSFVDAVAPKLGPLELKDRIDLVANEWAARLPDAYPEALKVVCATLASPLGDDTAVAQDAFYHWIHARFVETRGLAHVGISLDAMVEITQRSTAEFCVRPFLQREPERVLRFLTRMRDHPSLHVRRWVSEGTRPRLPWGLRLSAFVSDPTPVLALIAPLRRDPALYVRTSVANNLNDIAKDHPDLVVETVDRWLLEADNPHAPWLAKRALRHLVKQGHAGALAALGFQRGARAEVASLELDGPVVAVGSALGFKVVVVGRADERLNVDYAVTYQMGKGKVGSKVFKLKALEIRKGERVTLSKRHSFKPITTRTYHSGEHRITVLANGQPAASATFELRG